MLQPQNDSVSTSFRSLIDFGERMHSASELLIRPQMIVMQDRDEISYDQNHFANLSSPKIRNDSVRSKISHRNTLAQTHFEVAAYK